MNASGLPSGEPNYGLLSTIPEQQIIERLSSGMSLRTIASEFGCSGQALHQFIDKRAHIKAAQRVGYVSRMERREEELESAEEQVDISRARELLGHARWLAERGDPEKWGSKPVQVNVGVQVLLDSSAVGTIGDLLNCVAQQQETVEPAHLLQSGQDETEIQPE